MRSRIEAWLERLGAYIVRHGWCDPSGVTIVPSAAERPDVIPSDRIVSVE